VETIVKVTVGVATTMVAIAVYVTGHGLIPAAWLAVGPVLASLVLSPRVTALLAGWAVLLAVGLALAEPGPVGLLASHLSACLLLAGFAVANSALRAVSERRIRQARAVARVAESALLREVPPTVTAGKLASRYVSASPEARVGGDLLEVVPGPGHPRWLIGDTRGKGLAAVHLASVAMTSFRDACAQPGLSLPEIARVVDRSVTRAAGEEDFVTAVFAEFDPSGWLQLVICGHPPPLRLSEDGTLRPLTPTAYATPLGLHPDIQSSTFTVNVGDRLVFYTDGLLEARDRAGRYFQIDDCLDTLRHPDLEAAADELLSRLLAHSRRKLDDDVALLLLEATAPPVPALDLGHQPGAALAVA
jgi:phosphoserine phosphatase RsbU/P